MKRRIDPQIIKGLQESISELPRLTEEEAIALVPMFRSQDSEIRDCAAEMVYMTNGIDMKNTIQEFYNICGPEGERLYEIYNYQEVMDCIENDYDNKLAKIIHDENLRLRQTDQIIQNLF